MAVPLEHCQANMKFFGFVFLWGGYTCLVYGISQLQGYNASLIELAWPGKYQVQNIPPKDGSSNSTSGNNKFSANPANLVNPNGSLNTGDLFNNPAVLGSG